MVEQRLTYSHGIDAGDPGKGFEIGATPLRHANEHGIYNRGGLTGNLRALLLDGGAKHRMLSQQRIGAGMAGRGTGIAVSSFPVELDNISAGESGSKGGDGTADKNYSQVFHEAAFELIIARRKSCHVGYTETG